MKTFRAIIASCMTGVLVVSVWGKLVANYGMLGGWLAGLIIIGPMWFLNHYLGLIANDDDAVFIDMALGIAVASASKDIFLTEDFSTVIESLPTFLLVVTGGILGGLVAGLVEKSKSQENNKNSYLI
ncbi:hypothetical protein JCM16358_18230 [Halanaerocella petrolearia]